MEFLLQPITRSAVLEEVNENEPHMDPIRYPVVAPLPEIPLHPLKGIRSNGQIFGAEGAADSRVEDSPAASEQSIEQVDPKKPGWSRRHVKHDSTDFLANWCLEITTYNISRQIISISNRRFLQAVRCTCRHENNEDI